MADEQEAYNGTSSEETPIEKKTMTGNSFDFQSFLNEMRYRAVTYQYSHRFFRLRLNDSAPYIIAMLFDYSGRYGYTSFSSL